MKKNKDDGDVCLMSSSGFFTSEETELQPIGKSLEVA
jgi:hypothetical protein